MKHTFLSQIQAIVPVFVALSVMLSACSISVPHNNAPSNTSTNEPEANLSVEISHIAYGDFLSSRVATPNGLYLLQNIYPACTSLCYIDMQAQQEIFLCSNPNCTHSSANCNAYLPVNDDYFSYALAYYKENLYIFRTAGSDEQAPSLTEMSLDGSNKRTILELQSGESFYGRAYGCNDAILAEISHVDKDGNVTLTLEKIDLQNGSRVNLLTYPTSSYYSAITTVANQLVYVTNSNSKTQLFLYDINSRKELTSAAKENVLCEPFDGVNVSFIVNDPYLYGMTQADKKVTCQNLLTGQELTFCFPPTKADEIVRGILPLYDQTFALTIEKGGTPVECLFDIETGQLTGVEYAQTKTDMNQLVAEFGDKLLYQQAISERPLVHADQYGLVNEMCYLDQFAVVSKSDFEKGIKGQPITPLVID